MKNLIGRGFFSTEREIAYDVKEKLVHNVVDSDTELKTTIREKTCELPDGNIIFAVDDCFCCVEVLFQPVSRRHPQEFVLQCCALSQRNCPAVSVDYDTQLKSTAETTRTNTSVLPNGNIITFGAKRCRYAKGLFLTI